MTKRIHNLLHRTITTHRLLDDDDKVLVAVSGGADSLCLLSLLLEYNRKHRKNWDILAVHVDPGYPGWRTPPLERIFQRLNVNYRIVRGDAATQMQKYHENLCYVCARERRRLLFETARTLGIRKVALAHHLEDVNETYLLNLLFTASAATFVPRQGFFGGKLEVVRPLYRFDKETIRKALAAAGLRTVRNRCPVEKTGQRLVIRRFLDRLYRRYPRIKTNIFAGISNLKPDYLPD
jgi:tRNA 2-thiocytidine biosynthesis protein TtcA